MRKLYHWGWGTVGQVEENVSDPERVGSVQTVLFEGKYKIYI